jgi:hypothetical protein
LKAAIAASLAISTLLFVVWSRHWPLVGDASLIHYIGFLIERGWAPYRTIGDMNMPGSFLIEMAAMKVFGGGALAWRVYDFTLLAVAASAFYALTKRAGWFPAVFAGALFALVHGRDGLAQGGQRDLTMGVLLVAATAVLSLAINRRAWWGMLGFGLLAGVAFTIKPTALPLSFAQLCLAAWGMRIPVPVNPGRNAVLHPVWTVVWAACGFVVAPLVALGFLLRQHALAAFWANLHGLAPFYASLGHRPLGFLLRHSISPLLALVLLWFAVLGLARPRMDLERGLLLCGAAFGLVSYVVQARGFPYYRYPLLAFLLPLMALDFAAAMEWGRLPRARAAGALSVAALCVGGFFLGPQSAILVHRYRWWESGFSDSLERNLNRLGGATLSGKIQCIDSISGCDTTLYRMKLLPATGILLDFPLFGPPEKPVVAQARDDFREQVFAHPPRVIVVSSALYVDGPGDYRKLERWPEVTNFLARDYRLDTDWKPDHTERWWSREEFPPRYRIYVLHQEAKP